MSTGIGKPNPAYLLNKSYSISDHEENQDKNQTNQDDEILSQIGHSNCLSSLDLGILDIEEDSKAPDPPEIPKRLSQSVEIPRFPRPLSQSVTNTVRTAPLYTRNISFVPIEYPSSSEEEKKDPMDKLSMINYSSNVTDFISPYDNETGNTGYISSAEETVIEEDSNVMSYQMDKLHLPEKNDGGKGDFNDANHTCNSVDIDSQDDASADNNDFLESDKVKKIGGRSLSAPLLLEQIKNLNLLQNETGIINGNWSNENDPGIPIDHLYDFTEKSENEKPAEETDDNATDK
jgi:hypothetical protein